MGVLEADRQDQTQPMDCSFGAGSSFSSIRRCLFTSTSGRQGNSGKFSSALQGPWDADTMAADNGVRRDAPSGCRVCLPSLLLDSF